MEFRKIDEVTESVERICTNMRGLDSALLVLKTASIHEFIPIFLHNLLKNGGYGIYVSLNKPYNTMHRVFKNCKCDLERIYFIDCVTKLAHKMYSSKDEKVMFTAGPHDITEGGSIPLAIEQYLNSIPTEKFVIIDALRKLTIYNDEKTVTKFIKKLIQKTENHNLKVIVLTHEADDTIIRLLDQSFDIVAKI
ncbi:MAG: hypothetical protein KKD39_08770 [Candidatus Altiarchaeota archaeon]|nr:hypothetical protein [Candidatus Altiarchaeota archaeon]